MVPKMSDIPNHHLETFHLNTHALYSLLIAWCRVLATALGPIICVRDVNPTETPGLSQI